MWNLIFIILARQICTYSVASTKFPSVVNMCITVPATYFILILEEIYVYFILTFPWWKWTCSIREVHEIYYIRPLLVGNLFQLHRPHQIWLPHEYCHYCHYWHYHVRISTYFIQHSQNYNSFWNTCVDFINNAID